MATGDDVDDETLLVAEAQLLLAEKRTSLSTIRTGIAVAALPLSVVSILIATSRMYDPAGMAHLLVPLLGACALLFLFGAWLMLHATIRIHRYDQRLRALQARNRRVAELLQ
ncbi:MAG: hypothetical protein JNM25_19995 [Planctomycetes bacterium]|nr:hypothetical protein [Planctomycetota bacterium]